MSASTPATASATRNGPTPSPWTRPATSTSTAALVGGTAGYNLQFGAFVFGLEGDFGLEQYQGLDHGQLPQHLRDHPTTWLGTARGRIGYAFDRFLPYFTGGAAFGDVKGSLTGRRATSSRPRSAGPRAAGVEYAFVDNWSAKIEYLYVDLGKATCDATCSGGNPMTVTVHQQHRARRRELQVLSGVPTERHGSASLRRALECGEPGIHSPPALKSIGQGLGSPIRAHGVSPEPDVPPGCTDRSDTSAVIHNHTCTEPTAGTGETVPFSLRSDGWAGLPPSIGFA